MMQAIRNFLADVLTRWAEALRSGGTGEER